MGVWKLEPDPVHLLLYYANEPLKTQRKILKKAVEPQPMNGIMTIHTNVGAATTITEFLIPTQMATRPHTSDPKIHLAIGQRQAICL